MADVRLTATNPEDSSVVPVACNAKGELLLEEPTISSDDYVRKTGDTMSGGLHLGDKIILNATDGSATFAEIENLGRLLVGTTSALGDSNSRLNVVNSGPADIYIGRSDGNADAGSRIGQFVFQSYAGSSYGTIATIQAIADGASGANDKPGRLVFSTTADGSSSSTERLRIESSGIATFASDVVISSRNKQWMIVESNGLAHLVEQTRAAEMRDTTEYPPLRDIPGELTMVEQQLQKVLEKLRMIPEAGWEVWDGSDTN